MTIHVYPSDRYEHRLTVVIELESTSLSSKEEIEAEIARSIPWGTVGIRLRCLIPDRGVVPGPNGRPAPGPAWKWLQAAMTRRWKAMGLPPEPAESSHV